VIDDDRDFAESLADILTLHGFVVEVALSGGHAVSISSEDDFDLLLLDMKMPDKNGLETLTEIRAMKPAARGIIITGYGSRELLKSARDAGAVGVLEKPVDIDYLVDLIARMDAEVVVLVTDDDEDFARSLQEVLEGAGYATIVANNGGDALGYAAAERVDLMLLDLRMPDIGGLDVYLTLREMGCSIPTLIVTGYAEEEWETLERLHSASAKVVLTKPVSADELIDTVHMMVNA
jgi:DNA-binding NtrC family response regulator